MIQIKNVLEVLKENHDQKLDAGQISELAGINRASASKQLRRIKYYNYKIEITKVVQSRGQRVNLYCLIKGEKK